MLPGYELKVLKQLCMDVSITKWDVFMRQVFRTG